MERVWSIIKMADMPLSAFRRVFLFHLVPSVPLVPLIPWNGTEQGRWSGPIDTAASRPLQEKAVKASSLRKSFAPATAALLPEAADFRQLCAHNVASERILDGAGVLVPPISALCAHRCAPQRILRPIRVRVPDESAAADISRILLPPMEGLLKAEGMRAAGDIVLFSCASASQAPVRGVSKA